MLEVKTFEGVEFRSDGMLFRFGEWKSGWDNAKGYKCVEIKGKKFYVHRIIATLFIPNDNPKDFNLIDHLNHDRSDNCVENLRWVSNRMNSHNLLNHSKHGVGVYFQKRKKPFYVKFTVNGKSKNFGCFKTKEEAQIRRDEVIKTL